MWTRRFEHEGFATTFEEALGKVRVVAHGTARFHPLLHSREYPTTEDPAEYLLMEEILSRGSRHRSRDFPRDQILWDEFANGMAASWPELKALISRLAYYRYLQRVGTDDSALSDWLGARDDAVSSLLTDIWIEQAERDHWNVVGFSGMQTALSMKLA